MLHFPALSFKIVMFFLAFVCFVLAGLPLSWRIRCEWFACAAIVAAFLFS